MPEYLSPGVYMEEIEVGPKPIEGVATSNLGILGETERGPRDIRLISSWLQFRRLYGDPIDGIQLAHAVRGFFDNGGKRCFMARVVGDQSIPATADMTGLLVSAVGPGDWGNNLMVRVSAAGSGDDDRFRVTILYFRDGVPANFVDPTAVGAQADPNYVEPTVLESYDDLSVDLTDTNEVLRTLAASSLIDPDWDPAVDPRVRPPDSAGYTTLAAGADGNAVILGDYEGEEVQGRRAGQAFLFRAGLQGLADVDEVSILSAPDEHTVANLRARTIDQCLTLRDRFAVFSVAPGSRDAANINPDPPNQYSAVYWPWIKVPHPRTNQETLVTPVGHMAGIMARTDIERGVHKAPANAVVRGATDLEFGVTRAMQDVLNPRGVNVIRDFRSDRRGIRLWGARTMSADPSWKYINVRRLFLFLEESIDEGTQWVVFEPNAEPLWDRVRRSIENFLLTVWRNGALMGTTQDEAFYVKCDRSTMTQDDIDNGRLICYIGVAPVKPAEFVVFRIHQWTAGTATAV